MLDWTAPSLGGWIMTNWTAQPLYVVAAPASIRMLGPRAARVLLLYLALCGVVLGAAAALIFTHRDDALDAFTAYLLPESWRETGRFLVGRFFGAQLRVVVVNATIGGGLMLVSIFLFPIKEKLSATFEEEARLVNEPANEFALWFQAWEEVRLFLLFITAQMSIFWIGYSPDPTRKTLAAVLSYGFLFTSFGIDFLAPLLQRHRQRYNTIYKTLFQQPILLLGFGATFTLPTVLASKLAERNPHWGLGVTLALIFGANVLCISWAAIAGTWVGARLLPAAHATTRPVLATRAIGWIAILGLLGANTYAFGAVGLALHQKSQILKCYYSVDPSSIAFDRPGLGGLLAGEVQVGMRMKVDIENPTEHDVVVEKNRLEVVHAGEVVVQSSLTPMHIQAGKRASQVVELPMRIQAKTLRQGRDLLSLAGWAITLYLEVAPGFEFPVYLLAP